VRAHGLAYAKLNLSLQVIGVRLDGYHEIQSLVQTIDLADRIVIETAPAVHVACSTRLSGPNIAESAVRELLQEKGSQEGVHIWIEKRIPIGAGLGGGSSDAAAVLSIVNRLIPPRISESRLAEIGGRIGSDVPLFLTGGCVGLTGVGRPEQQYPVRSETFVLLVPDIHCSTKDVYEAWEPADTSDCGENLGRNDLAAAAIRIHPELEAASDAMRKLEGLYFGMTGSGSAFFAAFSNETEARSAFEKLTRQEPDSRVYYCQPTRSGFAESVDSGFEELSVLGHPKPINAELDIQGDRV